VRAIGEWIPWFSMALASVERTAGTEAPTLEQRVRAAAGRWALTERQTEVLALLVHGRSNRQIALELDCAEGTVEVHVKALFKKADVAGRTELTARVAEMVTRRVVEPA
jgi:DNA-binding NarL/FixJ family response regulator